MITLYILSTPEWVTFSNFIIGIFVFIVLLGGYLVVYYVRRPSEISALQLDRATAAEALVKTRDSEIVRLKEQIDELKEDLESIGTEHKTLIGISIGELMAFWATKEEIEAKVLDLEHQLRVERKRKDGE